MFVINDTGSDIAYTVIESSTGYIVSNGFLGSTGITEMNLPNLATVSALSMTMANLSTDGVRILPSAMSRKGSFKSPGTCEWEYLLTGSGGSWHKVGAGSCGIGKKCVATSKVNSDYISGHDGQTLFLDCIPDINLDEERN